jgi:phage-related protein
VTVSAPSSHLEESLKLEADLTVDLWQARLRGGATVRWWNGPTRTWQGNEYTGLACQIQGEKKSSDSQVSRPILTIANPDGVFSTFAAEGLFDLAEVIRKRVLQSDFQADANVFEQRVWIVGRPSAVKAQVISLELRSTTDMPNFKTPGRTFSPPEFPCVVL